MVIREFPEEFLEREKLYKPYWDAGKLDEAPKEVQEAYMKNKEWAWKQGQ